MSSHLWEPSQVDGACGHWIHRDGQAQNLIGFGLSIDGKRDEQVRKVRTSEEGWFTPAVAHVES